MNDEDLERLLRNPPADPAYVPRLTTADLVTEHRGGHSLQAAARKAVLPAGALLVVAALLGLVALPYLLPIGGNGASASPDSTGPSPWSSVTPPPGARVIPWAASSPSPSPTASAAVSAVACSADELSASVRLAVDRGSAWILVTNESSRACSVSGRPIVTVHAVAGGPTPAVRESDGWEAMPFSREPIVLEPRGQAQIELGLGSWCGPSDQAPTTIDLTLPPGVDVQVAGFAFGQCFENQSSLDVSGYGPVTAPLPSPAPGLTAAILAPQTVRAGEALRYWVVIANPTQGPVSLAACADFSQRLGQQTAAGALDCPLMGAQLGAGQSLALEMELQVPEGWSGRQTLVWTGMHLAAKVDVLVRP